MRTFSQKMIWGLISFLSISFNALAEDIELYRSSGGSTATGAKSNVLFVVDTSGSMNDPIPAIIPQTITLGTTTSSASKITQTFDIDEEGWSGLDSGDIEHDTETITELSADDKVLTLVASERNLPRTTRHNFVFDKKHAEEVIDVTFDLINTNIRYIRARIHQARHSAKEYLREIKVNGQVIDNDAISETRPEGDFGTIDKILYKISFKAKLDSDGKASIVLRSGEKFHINNFTVSLTGGVIQSFDTDQEGWSGNIEHDINEVSIRYGGQDHVIDTKKRIKLLASGETRRSFTLTKPNNSNAGETIYAVFDMIAPIAPDPTADYSHYLGQITVNGSEVDLNVVPHGLEYLKDLAGLTIFDGNDPVISQTEQIYKVSFEANLNHNQEVDIVINNNNDQQPLYIDNFFIGLKDYPSSCTTNCSSMVTASTVIKETYDYSRLTVVKQVIKEIIKNSSNVNVGLMRFDSRTVRPPRPIGVGSQGGYIVSPIKDIEDVKSEDDDNHLQDGDFKFELDQMGGAGYTPLAETLYEAYLYYSGKRWKYGANPEGNGSSDQTHPDAHTNGTYNAPSVNSLCQKNIIVLLSDGQPNTDDHADTLIQAMDGFEQTGTEVCGDAIGSSCLDELAKVLFKTDLSSSLPDTQNIITYTVGMNLPKGGDGENLLKATATNGGGNYFSADTYDNLLTAYEAVFGDIKSIEGAFTSPAVSANSFSRTTHRNELYYSLFEPKLGPHWPGNLKKFKLAFDVHGKGKIVDKNDKDAIDPATGYFYENIQSYWTDDHDQTQDGGDVYKGGAAAKLTTDRTVYSNIVSNDLSNDSDNEISLANKANIKNIIDPNLTDEQIEDIIKWARGWDIKNIGGSGTDQPRKEMGDSLHSKATVVEYGTKENPNLVIFTINNDGFLNAINEKTGKLLYSFIPKALLSNLDDLYNNNASTPKPYGLDGGITAKVTDTNNNGTFDHGDIATLYIGMRRGGNNYYSIDVTNKTAPRLNWVIKGGPNGDANYKELGQSWSTPVIKKMKIKGTLTDVMIIGGGYDVNQDSNTTHEDDTIGRAIYIINAATGARLWWAGPSGSGADTVLANMTNSIPSEILTLDFGHGEGVSRLYAADTRGQIFRFDINTEDSATEDSATEDSATDLVTTAYRIAKLSDEGDQAGTRRTYYRPDAAFMNGYLALIIGTGYRAHPLEVSEQNRIYMIKDVNVYKSPAKNPATIEDTDLLDVTTSSAIPHNAKGWYFNLELGEKILSEPLIIDKVVILTSFTPGASSTPVASTSNSCSPPPAAGTSRAYYLNLKDASVVWDLIKDGNKNISDDRSEVIEGGGIPPSPTILITKEGTVGLAGLNTLRLPEQRGLEKTYWYEDRSP